MKISNDYFIEIFFIHILVLIFKQMTYIPEVFQNA